MSHKQCNWQTYKVSIVLLWSIVSANPQANGDIPCGKVNALSITRNHSSQDIYIYSGDYFYLFDLKTNKLSDPLSIEEYWPNVSTPLDAVFLSYKATGRSKYLMVFGQKTTLYIYGFTKDAFREDTRLVENFEHRTNMKKFKVNVHQVRQEWSGVAFDPRGDTPEDRRFKLCQMGSLYECPFRPDPNDPIHDCKQRGLPREFTKPCAGLAMAHYDDNYYLTMATDEELLLFPMDEEYSKSTKPLSRVKLSKIFKCSSFLSNTLTAMVTLVSAAVLVNIVAFGILVWKRRQRLQTREISLDDESKSANIITTTKAKSAKSTKPKF